MMTRQRQLPGCRGGGGSKLCSARPEVVLLLGRSGSGQGALVAAAGATRLPGHRLAAGEARC